MSDKEFSLYAEEEKIISRSNEFVSSEEINNIQSSYTDDDLKHLIRNHGENRSH